MLEMLKKTAVGQSLLNWLINYKIKKRESRQLTSSEVNDLRRQFGQDTKGFDRYLHDNVRCRVVIDPDFVRIVKKLQADFGLRNFVETGTYDGETSLAMSLLFEKVFTCDVIDWKRRPEIYFADNLTYETKTSPDFLRAHLPEIRKQSIFFLDAHWGAFWPLRDELSIIFSQCENPLIVIDDFDAGNGLCFDQYEDRKLDLNYIAENVPPDYKFCLNPWSYRNRGIIFIFPGTANYGCRFADRDRYSEEKHGVWSKRLK
jgi:hypothetical protein